MPKGSVDYCEGRKQGRLENEGELETLRERLNLLETLILSHNKEMDGLCNNKKNCGYENYERDCPNCPKDYKIEL